MIHPEPTETKRVWTMHKKAGILLVIAGVLMSVSSIEAQFIESPLPITWVLMGPGLVGGPAMILVGWRMFRKSAGAE